jgi:hypothetical protein
MSSRLALLLIGLPACFQPSYREGIACSADGECPSPLSCQAGFCVKPGGTAPRHCRNDHGSTRLDGGCAIVPEFSRRVSPSILCLLTH